MKNTEFIRKFPDKCCADVKHKDESQPCNKVAVAVRVDDEEDNWWPVCAYHARKGHMVPLAELLRAMR